ncbi:hypothetical protein [Leifsonia poae]|uniref:hypothetical protein n=1 Tax=Leifsonia poae TaxID=110933 RepID=UPI001CC17AEB|nr:hypothetical protein [Leifsonia poae]
MSQHHKNQKWSTHSPKLRKLIEPMLPAQCLNCPHPVTPEDKWQVGHRRDAALGGEPTIENAGPTHAWCPACRRRCNQRAGGQLGARIRTANNVSRSRAQKDIRSW